MGPLRLRMFYYLLLICLAPVFINAQASCASPPSVANSYVISQSPYSNGTFAAYGCNSQYTLSGTATLLCYNGLWVGTIPACEPINNNNWRYVDSATPTWVLVIIGVLVGVFLLLLLAALIWWCCYCCGCCPPFRGRGADGGGDGKGGRRRIRRPRPRVLHVSPLFVDDSYSDGGYYYDPPYDGATHAVQTVETDTANVQTDGDHDGNIHSKAVQVYHIDGYLRHNRVGHALVQTGEEKKAAPSPPVIKRDLSDGSSNKPGSVDKGTVTPKMVNVLPNDNAKHWKTVSNHVRREDSPRPTDKFSTMVNSMMDDGQFKKPAKDPRKERPMWMPHSNNVRNINTSTR